MNHKTCPKCGENNPAEAIMCWACYTPLSGGVTSATKTPHAGVHPGEDESGGEKKRLPVQPWQMGVLGAGVLLGLFMAGRTFMSGPGENPGGEGPPPIHVVPRNPAGTPLPPTVPIDYVNPSAENERVIGDPPPPFGIVAAPNPSLDYGVMGIVSTKGNIGVSGARKLALYTRQQLAAPNHWKTLQIYVFADIQTAQTFANYQANRQGYPLADSNYAALTNVWPRTLVRCEYRNGKEVSVKSPMSSPTTWWRNS